MLKKIVVGALVALFVIGGSFSYANAQTMTISQLVELFISLGIISPDKASVARTAVSGTSSTGTSSVVTSGSTGTTCYKFTRDFGVGTSVSASDIEELNSVLAREGISGARSTVFDKDFSQRVVRFQAKYGIRSSGYVGPLTRAKLNNLPCETVVLPTPEPTPVQPSIPEQQSGITVLSPNGGENWIKNSIQTIKWSDTGPINCPALEDSQCAAPTYDIRLEGMKGCDSGTCVTGFPVYTILKNVSGTSHNWYINGNDYPDGSYKVQVCRTGTTLCDESDSYFKVVSGITGQPSIYITSPVGGTYKIGSVPNTGDYFSYSATLNNIKSDGVFSMYMTDRNDGSGTLTYMNSGRGWDLNSPNHFGGGFSMGDPYKPGTYYLYFEWKGYDGSFASAFSKSFNLVSPTNETPAITVLSPNGGERWIEGNDYKITWKPSNIENNALQKIDLYVINQANGSNAITPSIGRGNTGWDTWTPRGVTGTFKVKVCQTDTTNCDTSDSSFTITSPVGQNCPATNIRGYSVPAMSNGESRMVTQTNEVPNGKRTAQTTFNCVNGQLVAGPEVANITCNSGYTSVGLECILLQAQYHSADTNKDWKISDGELEAVTGLYNYRAGTTRTGEYHVEYLTTNTVGGASSMTYAPGPGNRFGATHSADSNKDWKISLLELTRVTELKNAAGYRVQEGTEDGFAPIFTTNPPVTGTSMIEGAATSNFGAVYFSYDEIMKLVNVLR